MGNMVNLEGLVEQPAHEGSHFMVLTLPGDGELTDQQRVLMARCAREIGDIRTTVKTLVSAFKDPETTPITPTKPRR